MIEMEKDISLETGLVSDAPKEDKRDHSVVKIEANKFIEAVSLIGLRHATDQRNSKFRRIVWWSFVVLGVGFAIYQIQEQIEEYLTYPYNMEYRPFIEKTIQFPQVTICPNKQLLKIKLQEYGMKI